VAIKLKLITQIEPAASIAGDFPNERHYFGIPCFWQIMKRVIPSVRPQFLERFSYSALVPNTLTKRNWSVAARDQNESAAALWHSVVGRI
jgi:hypothetical protein